MLARKNAHLRLVNSAFSCFASLKLDLFIQPLKKKGMTNLLFSHSPLFLFDEYLYSVLVCGAIITRKLR